MEREELRKELNHVFCDVFNNEEIVISENTVSKDIEGWDSLMHITLIGAVEEEFGVKFAMKDVVSMKNVGAMMDIILSQM